MNQLLFSPVTHVPLQHEYDEIPINLFWGKHKSSEAIADVRADDFLTDQAEKFAIDSYDDAVIKVVGEDTFLLDNYRLIDYEYIREKIMIGEVKLQKLYIYHISKA